MPYLYETHLHTRQASLCGSSSGAEYIPYYKELGYSGIIVTDHFFNGNSSIPRALPWEEKIELFCKGYEDAKAEGDRLGLQVFFGWECNFDMDEYLIYGLDKEWLLTHPEMMEWDHITHFKEITKAGGLVVQAHPFRQRDYMNCINLHPYQCHAWEIANAGNMTDHNQLAYRYAKEHGIPMTVGSDIHKTNTVNLYAMAFDEPLTNIHDYVTRVKTGLGYSLQIPDSQRQWDESITTHLPLYFYDKENNKKHITDLKELFQ